MEREHWSTRSKYLIHRGYFHDTSPRPLIPVPISPIVSVHAPLHTMCETLTDGTFLSGHSEALRYKWQIAARECKEGSPTRSPFPSTMRSRSRPDSPHQSPLLVLTSYRVRVRS